MIEANRPLYKVSAGVLLIAIACIGMVSLCGWLVAWCLNGTNLKQFFLVMVLLSIGLFTLFRQIWKTRRCVGDLLQSVEIDLPEHLQTQIALRRIARSSVVLVQSAEPLAFCHGFLKPTSASARVWWRCCRQPNSRRFYCTKITTGSGSTPCVF